MLPPEAGLKTVKVFRVVCAFGFECFGGWMIRGNARWARLPFLGWLLSLLMFAGVVGSVRAEAFVTARGKSILILYDEGGAWGHLGEHYAQMMANLVSHFGRWEAMPVERYRQGRMQGHRAVVYLGTHYGEKLPEDFLKDVSNLDRPVLWINDNLWQLTPRYPDFLVKQGWTWMGFKALGIKGVKYKDVLFTRDAANKAAVLDLRVTRPAGNRVLGTYVMDDASERPWAIQSGLFTYVSEIPLIYLDMDDRYVAFAGLLYDVLEPQAKLSRRALVRLEDVGPISDPKRLAAIADLLHARKIPFSAAVYPRYVGPLRSGGPQVTCELSDRPEVVEALKYMTARGGTLIMHGYTHQLEGLRNPYSGQSAEDFEFYRTHVNDQDVVVYDGPVPGDSARWAESRVAKSREAFRKAGLALPTIFETPHYAASPVDYEVFGRLFSMRYERGQYFPGYLNGRPDAKKAIGQFFPYPVTDVYGSRVIPENLGNIRLTVSNHHPIRLAADLVRTARLNKVIPNAFASFFYHPYLGHQMLAELVDALASDGWTFVSAGAVQKDFTR